MYVWQENLFRSRQSRSGNVYVYSGRGRAVPAMVLLYYFWLIATIIMFIIIWFTYFVSSLLTVFFILEILWLFCSIFFVYGFSVFSGLYYYLVINGIMSVCLIFGFLATNVILLLFGCFGKVGYFPFLFLIMLVWYCSSYLFIMFDYFSKYCYLFSCYVYFCFVNSFNVIVYYICVYNFIFLIFFIRFLFVIKHLIFISSVIFFLLGYLLIIIEDVLFGVFMFVFYLYSSIIVMFVYFYS